MLTKKAWISGLAKNLYRKTIELENKTLDITDLVTNVALNTKVNEIKNRIEYLILVV